MEPKSNINLLKKNFIVAYGDTFGNVTESCRLTQISRKTFYQWKNNDPEFAAEIENVEPKESFKDFVENAAVKKIKEGDTAMIIFAAKTKLKDRGWVERQEITGADGDKLNAFTVEIVNGSN